MVSDAGIDELTGVLTDFVVGCLRRVGIDDLTMDDLLVPAHARRLARWLVSCAPELRDDVIDDCPLEL
jgi:hypothetical protein